MCSQGSLGLAAVLLTLSSISTVEARCVEDAFGNVSCSPVIRPGIAFGISLAIFIALLVVFGMLARQRRNRMRAANLAYIQNTPALPQQGYPQQGFPQQGFPPSPYASPHVPPYPSYQPPYGPPPTDGYNPEQQKHGVPYVPAPQYPPPSYVVA